MLETVHIRDYALIEALDIEFQPGFNVITGETGAGKSIVIGALSLALGARASADTVRTGADKALVETVFRLKTLPPRLSALLDDLDIVLEDDLLLLSRSVAADGRSRALINGRLATIAALSAIGDELVDLHGQHEHQSLLKPECQVELLDAYGGHSAEAREVAEKVTRLHRMRREMAALESDDRDRARQAEFMRFEISEIDGACLFATEEDDLRGRLHLITHAESIHALASEAYTALYEADTDSAIDRMGAALRCLEGLERIDASFADLRAQVAEAQVGIESAATDLRAFTSRMDFNPEELNTLNARLSQIGDLKRKYGNDIPEILAYRDKTAVALAEYDNREAHLSTLSAEYERHRADTETQAAALSKQRKEAAHRMDAQILKTLHALDMPAAAFETRFETTDLCAHGIDKVTFMLSANAGEAMKPLRQVASGGEISRIMLALKSVFAEQDTVPTLIFDEIDAGIGGATARRVAEKLAGLARSHQLLCITHLAQIAAPAKAHYVVLKREQEKQTRTSVTESSGADREKEIARLLDGSVSEVSLGHARALLAEHVPDKKQAKKGKQK